MRVSTATIGIGIVLVVVPIPVLPPLFGAAIGIFLVGVGLVLRLLRL